MNVEDRIRGSLYGALVGDAMGAPYEFLGRDQYRISTEMEKVPHFKLDAGSYTDDGALMLATCHSLIESNGFDPEHLMDSMAGYMLHGFMSVNNKCFDIGGQTRDALSTWMRYKHTPYVGHREPRFSGNGGIMRLGPVPLYYYRDGFEGIRMSILASMVTHASPQCLECARLMSEIIIGFMRGHDKETVLGGSFGGTTNSDVKALYNGSFRNLSREHVKTSGYVIDTLEAALWALWTTDTFEAGIMALLPLGDDVDTVCCVYGQIAGAHYGYNAIPRRWVFSLQNKVVIDGIIDRFTSKILHGTITNGPNGHGQVAVSAVRTS